MMDVYTITHVVEPIIGGAVFILVILYYAGKRL